MWGTIHQSQLSYISFGQWLYHNHYTLTQTLENNNKSKIEQQEPSKQPTNHPNKHPRQNRNKQKEPLGQESV